MRPNSASESPSPLERALEPTRVWPKVKGIVRGLVEVQNTDAIVDDEVFSRLRDAVIDIADEYQREFGRPPTHSERQRLMLDALLPIDPPDLSSRRYLLVENAEPSAVKIEFNREDTKNR
jgi:hypothetical protein